MGQTYKEMLQSPLWQKKRLEVFNQKGFRCEECGDEESQLAVHHKYYKKDFKPWDYQDDAYMVFCTTCHEAVHKAKKIVLTVEEAKIIELIRGKLNEKDTKHLKELLDKYTEDDYGDFFYLLPRLIEESTLLNLVFEFVGQQEDIASYHMECEHYKKELKKNK